MSSPRHRTCAALCDDPAANPHGLGDSLLASVARQSQGWSATVAAPPSATDLLEEVPLDMSAQMTGGIGVLTDATAASPGGVLKILHGIQKHPGPNFRGEVFACCGDVLDQDLDIIKFKSDLLAVTAEVRIAADADHHQQLLDADATLLLVEEHADGAARTELAKTRNSAFVPTHLLPHVLDKDLTPREAFETLIPVIEDLGLTAAAQPLIQHLLVASTKVSTGGTTGTRVPQASAGTLQGSREVAHKRRENLLHRHLPALRGGDATQSDPALLGIMNSAREVRNATTDDLADRRAQRERATAPQTVEERWPSFADRLCKLCEVQDPEALPECWHDAAAWKRGSGTTLRSALQEATAIAAARLRVDHPQVAVQHADALSNWTFAGASSCNTGTGLLPMTATPPGAISLNARRRQNLDFEQAADDTTMIQGSTSIAAADARPLRSGGAHVPMNFDEAEAGLEACSALLGAALGTEHTLVKACLESLRQCRKVRQQFKAILTKKLGEGLTAATLSYHCHVEMCAWFEEQWRHETTDTLPPPTFGLGFRHFARGNDLSWLPDTTPVQQFEGPSRTEARPSEAAASGGTNRSRTNPPPNTGDAPTRTPRERARNGNRDPRFVGEGALAQKMRRVPLHEAVARTDGVPEAAEGRERCLSWHLKGSCFADCPRKHDHLVLTGADKENLHNWCKVAYEMEQGTGRRDPHPRLAEPLTTREAEHRSPVLASKKIKTNLNAVTSELGENVNRNRLLVATPPRAGPGPPSPKSPAIHPRRPPSSPRAIQKSTPAPAGSAAATAPVAAPLKGESPKDELDLLIREAVQNCRKARTWRDFFDMQRDPRGDWGPAETLPHPAASLLHSYKRLGAPVQMHGRRWDPGRKRAALERGPHKSAKEHRRFLREEHTAMMRKGHWAPMPAELVENHPELRLGPLGVVPQRERRPRTISDHSYFGINDDTIRLAPEDAMQFGRALQRLLQRTNDANPRYGPVCLAKTDIADGFYRIGLRPDDAMKLAVLFPTEPHEERLVGIPLTLPMGWAESPPAFCTATETIADFANDALARDPGLHSQSPHRPDDIAESEPSAETCRPVESTAVGTPAGAPTARPAGLEDSDTTQSCAPRSRASAAAPNTAQTQTTAVPTSSERRSTRQCLHLPVRQWDVCVDDFLGLCQGGRLTRKRVKRALFHALDKVFRPVDAEDNSHRQEPASMKKLKKDDATWQTRKILLGWIADTVKGTIELPPHRVDRLRGILDAIRPGQRHVSVRDWHKVQENCDPCPWPHPAPEVSSRYFRKPLGTPTATGPGSG